MSLYFNFNQSQTDSSLGVGAECDGVGDHVTIVDGSGSPGSGLVQTDPQLIKFCRGGQVPPVTSSGPDLFLLFHTSPFSVPRSSPLSSTGFLLDVTIKFVDAGGGAVMPRDKATGKGRVTLSGTG